MGYSIPLQPPATPLDKTGRVLPTLSGGLWKCPRVLEGTGWGIRLLPWEQLTPSSCSPSPYFPAILGKCTETPVFGFLESLLSQGSGPERKDRMLPHCPPTRGSCQPTPGCPPDPAFSWLWPTPTPGGSIISAQNFQAAPKPSSAGNSCPTPRH